MRVSRQTISKWELGSILPEVEKLVDLSKMFNCSVDQLLKDNIDFSNEVSQEQANVFHMHGYGAALILENEQDISDIDTEIFNQNRQKYIMITLEEVKGEEFTVIPNAYKALLTYMATNGIKEKHDSTILSCYEHEYFDDKGGKFMDIYIAIE